MKVSKRAIDVFNVVSGLSEKVLIGAGLSAIALSVYDDEAFDISRISQNWPSKKKNSYIVTTTIATMVVIFADVVRETILNGAYEYALAGEDEIKITL